MHSRIKCSICNRDFKSENEYLIHLEVNHIEQYEIFMSRLIDLDNTGYILDRDNKETIWQAAPSANEEGSAYIARDASKIMFWEPANFDMEATTIWSFPNRGEWATHNPKFRGNWSPYIPRNIILRYSEIGNYVLDQFLGSGTTLVEVSTPGCF